MENLTNDEIIVYIIIRKAKAGISHEGLENNLRLDAGRIAKAKQGLIKKKKAIILKGGNLKAL